MLLPLSACTTSDATSAADAPAPRSASVPPASPAPSGSLSASAARQDAQDAVDRLLAAGTAGDRSGWDTRVSTVDAAFAARSTVLFDNLRAMRPSRLRARLTGPQLQLPAARRAELGGTARVLQAQLTWRLRGEDADAGATVWLTVVAGPDGVRLAGVDDGSGLDSPAQPLWWFAPTTLTTRGDVTVLAGAGQDASRWARLAARAADDAREHLPERLARGWDGHVVVEVPASEADFTRVLGGAPSAYAGTAAVTRPEGPDTDAAVRVVVNPAVATGSDDELGTLLTHETVHVVTRSAGSPAPLWVVEGLAEVVALEAHPDQQAGELAALRAGDDQGALPPDTAFTGKGVTGAYAQAWLACRAVAERRGEDGLGRFYASLDAGADLGRAARTTLGSSGASVEGWARDARRRALGPAGG